MVCLRLIPASLVLLMSVPALAQEWMDYTSRMDRFSVNFPGQPKVQDIVYKSGLDAMFPGRVYTAERGRERYSVTVVDYTDAERVHTERAKNCPADAQSLCFGDDAAQGAGGWKYDVHGAVDFATWHLLSRDAKVTYFAWATIDRISGRQIHFTNSDGPRGRAGARAVSAVSAIPRREGQQRPVRDQLHERIPATPPRQVTRRPEPRPLGVSDRTLVTTVMGYTRGGPPRNPSR
jgi:hypothetical protein